MVERATERMASHSNVRVQREDAYRTSFEEETFDAVLLVNLLHVVKAPIAVAQECKRVLKPGGGIVAVDATRYGTPFLPMIGVIFRYIRRRGLPPSSNKSFSPDDLSAIVEGTGFAIQEQELIGRVLKAVCVRASKAD